jgi:hypothetical protein
MDTLPKSRLLRFVEQAMHLAHRAVAPYSSKFSKRRYTLHQHIAHSDREKQRDVKYQPSQSPKCASRSTTLYP